MATATGSTTSDMGALEYRNHTPVANAGDESDRRRRAELRRRCFTER